MIKAFLNRLFCPHLNWTDRSELSAHHVGKHAGYKDWRTDEGYWACTACGKVKNFGYRGIPIQWLPGAGGK